MRGVDLYFTPLIQFNFLSETTTNNKQNKLEDMEPISLKSLVVPRSLLKYPDVFCSLDRGCSLTKLMYVKSLPKDEANASLEMAIFANRNFSEGLDWLAARAREEGQFGAGKMIRTTGVGGEMYKAEVEEKLNMRVEYVHEFIAQQTGAHFLVSNFDDDAFCYPDDAAATQAVSLDDLPTWLQNVYQQASLHYGVNDGGRFPAIFGFCGSGIGFNKLNEDLSTEILGVSMNGGKSFLGLCKLLVGTNDYNEIMALAEKGVRGNVDTLASEMLAQGENSEYRMLPPDLPLFPFGKASDSEETQYNREDIAASILGSFVNDILPQIAAYAKMQRVRRVYLGGHMFSGQPFRTTFNMFMTTTVGMSPLKVRFLSNGHTGCIGALLVSMEESNQLREKISLG